MLAAVGFPLQEQFHPLFGGDIDAPSYISFQMTPLQTFWPIVVSAIFLLEANTALQTFKDPTEALWALKEDHAAGDLGFDPLNFGAKADLVKKISTSAGTAALAHVVLTQVEALGFVKDDAVVLRAEVEMAPSVRVL